MRLALILSVLAAPACADIDAALNDHILPGYRQLTEATASLASAAEVDCSPDALRPTFSNAYDAWIAISHIQFGPIEDLGLNLAMSFWPDPKDSTGKALGRLTRDRDPIVNDRDEFNEVSAAAQGFTALERLLYEDQRDAAYACRLTRAVAYGLTDKSARIEDGWAEFSELMRTAGDNTRYQSSEEAHRALYTALSSGLEFIDDQRLGRPLGTFDRPRPLRAEARRSSRSLRHITVGLTALESLADTFADDIPMTKAAFARAYERAASLNDPTLAGVADPAERFRVEALQQDVRDIRAAIIIEIGEPLGIQAGFNSQDGD